MALQMANSQFRPDTPLYVVGEAVIRAWLKLMNSQTLKRDIIMTEQVARWLHLR
jgi:hypothetical protein